MKSARTPSAEGTDADTTTAATDEDRLSPGEVRERAIAGAAVDVLRGVSTRFVGLVGLVILARLLTPHAFGTVAFGATIVTTATFFADGGIGNALIRRVDPPERADLQALLAFQLGLSTALAVGIGVALIPFGQLGQVTALMVMALPLTAVRAPGVIVLERQLRYRPLAVVDFVETCCYFGCAIVLVIEGWGVWGLASAAVFRALVGSTLLLSLVPPARLIPLPSWTRVRPLLGFGVRFQAWGAVTFFRDQGINAAIAVVAGVSALGIWSVAYRFLQIPLLFITSLWRVSYPGMSRLVAAGENVGATIERVVAVTAVACGLILAPLVAATPAWIPALLGTQWTDAVAVIPPASLHLMVVGPLSVALIGYLFAVGEAGAVLRSALVGIPLMFAVMIPLLTVIGVPAVGFGWMASGIGEATVLILAAREHTEFKVRPVLLPPTVFAVAGASMGWLVASGVGTTVVGGLVGALLATVVYLLALWVWHRSYLLDSFHLSIRGMRGVLGGPALN